METVYFTAAQLAGRSGDIPRELNSSTHLIYSSPATLAFNSPGAEGYGVKRAGLAVPGSVMLIVSPGCCGRNTSAISRMPGYEDHFFYLTMDETDLVTGRHLKKIPDAVGALCRGLEKRGKRPRVIMICITCVDALLGTDMERVCRRAQEKVPGVRVRPCYMYALTREGRKPPMVHVRQSIYELLEPRKKRSSSVNLLGFFAPLSRESELPKILSQAGVQRVRQIGACEDYDAFQEMAEANFNIVLNPEARPAAYDLQKRLGIPFIELSRFYQIDRIEAQYAALGQVLQTSFEDQEWKKEAVEAAAAFRAAFPDAVFSVGEGMNGNPFELACALVREGFSVREIFGTVSADSFVWIRVLAAMSPQTRIYSNLHPTMLHYREHYAKSLNSSACSEGEQDPPVTITAGRGAEAPDHPVNHAKAQDPPVTITTGRGAEVPDRPVDCVKAQDPPVTITIGRDAGWYHPEVPNVQWISDVQPFGYGAVAALFRALGEAMRTGSRDGFSPDIVLGKKDAESPEGLSPDAVPGTAPECQLRSCGSPEGLSPDAVPGKKGADDPEGLLPDIAVGKADTGCPEGLSADAVSGGGDAGTPGGSAQVLFPGGKETASKSIRGYRRFTTPFAPDQSGAVSVLYDMGGISVVCDAGGCTGNICGFDEPRWFKERSAVFSAGLRDMDAILGRDDRLVEKLAEAARQIPAGFAAVIGTPVPAVIGTDYRALCRMAEKKTGLPVLGISTDGMEYYDKGIEKTYLALLEKFCKKSGRKVNGCKKSGTGLPETGSRGDRPEDRTALTQTGVRRVIGVWGFTPLDFAAILTADELKSRLREQGYDEILCCGAGTGIEALAGIARAEKNLVVSPAGTAAAGWLEKEYGTPWEYGIPGEAILSESIFRKLISRYGSAGPGNGLSFHLSGSADPGNSLSFHFSGSAGPGNGSPGTAAGLDSGPNPGASTDRTRGIRKVLVVHQQVLADRIRCSLEKAGIPTATAGFFTMNKELLRGEDTLLREESDLRALVQEKGFDCVIADRALEPVLAGLPVRVIHLPHFAVSGEYRL